MMTTKSVTFFLLYCLTLLKPTQAFSAAQPKSLYERIGGAPAIEATVDQMYDRILGDESLAPFFADTDMKSQKGHQTAFLVVAFGGAKADFDIAKYIETKHAKSFEAGLNEAHFDSVAGHIVDSLVALEVTQELIDEAVEVVSPLRPLFEKSKK